MAHPSDAKSNLSLEFLVLFVGAFSPELEPHLGLLFVALLLALVGFQSLDAAVADAWKRFILRMVECSCCALFPVTGGLPHLDRLPHAVLDALGVLPGVAFAVVADENRLTKRDIVGDAVDGIMCALRVFDTALFVVVETVSAFLGAVHQAPVFVFDFPNQFNQQILAA